jgi:hypothetical protein
VGNNIGRELDKMERILMKDEVEMMIHIRD